jgi:hypothetical protein
MTVTESDIREVVPGEEPMHAAHVHTHGEAVPTTPGLAPILPAVGRFALHFAAMCATMCTGGTLLVFAVFGGAGLIGVSNLDQRYPEFPILVVSLGMAAGMTTWMWFRHHPARHTVEMSGATVVVGILIAGAYWTGVLNESSLPGWQQTMVVLCSPQCAVMLLVMLVRFKHYTGGARHLAHTG